MPTSAQTTGDTACAVLTIASAPAKMLADQRAEEQRCEEQAAAEPGADRDRRRHAFSTTSMATWDSE